MSEFFIPNVLALVQERYQIATTALSGSLQQVVPATASAVGAGAEQDLWAINQEFASNKWRISITAHIGTTAGVQNFDIKLYKGTDVLTQIPLQNGTKFMQVDIGYDESTIQYSGTYISSTPSIATQSFTSCTARDLSVAGNLKLSLKNDAGTPQTPSADWYFSVGVWEDVRA